MPEFLTAEPTLKLSAWFGTNAKKGLSSEDRGRWTQEDWLKASFMTGAWMFFNPLLGDDWSTMKPTGALLHVLSNVPVEKVKGADWSGVDRYVKDRWVVPGDTRRWLGLPDDNQEAEEGSTAPFSWYLTLRNLEG
jgi:hypothetical protein